MKNVILISLFTLLMATSTLKAQSSIVVKEVKVETLPFKIQNRTDGILPEIIFDDGRVAQLVVATSPLKIINVGMDIVESNCGKNIPTKCSLAYPVVNFEFKLVWKLHHDIKKVGTVLVNKSGQEILSDIQSFSFSDKLKYNKFYKEIGLKDPEFSCPKWEWLKVSSDKIQLLEWSLELMLDNIESDLAENQTYMAVMDLTLHRKNKKTYTLDYPKKVIKSAFSSDFNLFFGDVIGWTVQQPTHESCEVTIKPDLSDAITEFSQIKYGEKRLILKNSSIWDKFKTEKYENNPSKYKYTVGKEDLLYLLMLNLISVTSSQDVHNNITLTVSPMEIE